MHRVDGLFRDVVAEAIRSVVDRIVIRHAARLTQEHQLTSRIAQSLEENFDGTVVAGRLARVLVQEMPDRGRGSLEKKTGADLYVAVRVEGTSTDFSKGMFIQAKWADGARTDQRLYEQCEKIVRKSDKGAFVWIYGGWGTHAVPASEVLDNRGVEPSLLEGRNLAQHFRDVFDCVAGDRRLVMPGIFDDDEALNTALLEYGRDIGIALSVSAPDLGAVVRRRTRSRR